jgi:nucleoside-diphosphate-sugar epimerase
MRILFVGGTGVISRGVSRVAASRGLDLWLLHRGAPTVEGLEGVHHLAGDVRAGALADVVQSAGPFDVVVDWVAYTRDDAARDVEALRGRVGQYVFISSASVYQKPPVQYVATESTPLANPYWEYSRNKIAAEAFLLEVHRASGFPVTIVRPSFTYGDTMIPAALNSWQHPWSLVDRMRRGLPVVVHGDGSSLWTMTHNEDFARGFLGLLGHPQAIGHAFHITADEVLTWNQIYQAIARAAGVEAPVLRHVATDAICRRFPQHTGGLLGDKTWSVVFDNSKVKRLVPDFVATTPFHAGIRRTVAWFEAHPERQTVDAAWNLEMDALAALADGGTDPA